MKISQEVAEAARAGGFTVKPDLSTPHPEPVEGRAEIEAGMAAKSREFREAGGEIYVPKSAAE